MNHSTRRKHNIIAAFVVVIFVAPLFWMLLDREPPYSEHAGKTIPHEVKAGDQITVEWQMRVNRVCPGYIAREIVDSQNVLWNYDVQPSIRREQQFDVAGAPRLTRLRRSFTIPEQAAPGPARYRSLSCYICNPIQQLWPVCIRTPDVNFTILPREETTGKLKRVQRWARHQLRRAPSSSTGDRLPVRPEKVQAILVAGIYSTTYGKFSAGGRPGRPPSLPCP